MLFIGKADSIISPPVIRTFADSNKALGTKRHFLSPNPKCHNSFVADPCLQIDKHLMQINSVAVSDSRSIAAAFERALHLSEKAEPLIRVIVCMKQVTLEEIRIVISPSHRRARSFRGQERGIESLIGITLKPLPGLAAKRKIAGVTERDVFQEIERIGPLIWIGQKTVIFVVTNPRRRRFGSRDSDL